MAKQTYAQIQKQIATLEAQAAELKSAEVAGVIAKIKEAIKANGGKPLPRKAAHVKKNPPLPPPPRTPEPPPPAAQAAPPAPQA